MNKNEIKLSENRIINYEVIGGIRENNFMEESRKRRAQR